MGEIVVACAFPDVDLATADELCADLYDSLRHAVPEAPTARRRDNELHQDLGTIVTIVMASPVIHQLIRELSRWAARRHDTRLRMTRTDTQTTIDLTGPLTDRHREVLQDFLREDRV